MSGDCRHPERSIRPRSLDSRPFRGRLRLQAGQEGSLPSPSPHRAGRARIRASGCSHGGFADPVRLSGTVALTRKASAVSRRASLLRFRPCDASLPSAGSRWTRFPGLDGTVKALRLPAPLPLGLLIRRPAPCAPAWFVVSLSRSRGRCGPAPGPINLGVSQFFDPVGFWLHCSGRRVRQRPGESVGGAFSGNGQEREP